MILNTLYGKIPVKGGVTMSIIGKNILKRRKALGMTQEELAIRMGYKSKSTINKIELGINDIVQSKVVKFAEVLQTTPAFLMGLENGTHNDSTDTNELSEGQKQLYDFCSNVPDDKVDLILRVMKSIVEVD